jgi:2-hydroxychromene-2-carboxylate isomerase
VFESSGYFRRVAEICVRINEFTDPGCPWAYSAEPFRRRLNWLYEGGLEWVPRMVVLADTAEDYASRGYTAERVAESHRRFVHEHGMPIDTRVRPRVAGTRAACLAVVAARENASELETRRLLRALRVRHFSGEMLDEQATIDGATNDAGLSPDELRSWCASSEVEDRLADDMGAAREPLPPARVLDHKLANWSGGRRYTCPSYEITRLDDDVTISVPGFQPFASYEVVLANLVPGVHRHAPPSSVEEVLRWADMPLASQEVAVICDLDLLTAREELSRVAHETHVGAEGFWMLI